MGRGSLAEQVLPFLVEEGTRKRAPTASFQFHPSLLDGWRPHGLQQPSVWQEMRPREFLCRGWATQSGLQVERLAEKSVAYQGEEVHLGKVYFARGLCLLALIMNGGKVGEEATTENI